MKMNRLFLSGAAAFVVAATIGATPVFAASKPEGQESEESTTVTYTNGSVIEGDDGVWGVAVPTAYAFTNEKKTSNGSIELVGINGYGLADLGDNLVVCVKAKSAKKYDVVDGENKAAYKVTYTGTGDYTAPVVTDSNAAMDADGFTTADVATLKKTGPAAATVAELIGKATVKGTYSDKITYKITHTGDSLK